MIEAPEVHLFRVCDGDDAAPLSPDERARAERFRFDADRRAFVFARATLRRMLAARLAADPAALVFDYGAHGKPHLARHPALQFNLAHTRDALAITIAHDVAVGVDIERVAPERAALDAAAAFFAPRECAMLEAAAPESRHAAFFALWTLKESYLKARGDGLALPLDGCAFELDADLQPIGFAGAHGDDADWRFHRGTVFDDHAWALAVRDRSAPAPRIVVHR